jgi:hypothetical protein
MVPLLSFYGLWESRDKVHWTGLNSSVAVPSSLLCGHIEVDKVLVSLVALCFKVGKSGGKGRREGMGDGRRFLEGWDARGG